jgi:Carbohydrate-selective porin, OprB family/S-layer homology domain
MKRHFFRLAGSALLSLLVFSSVSARASEVKDSQNTDAVPATTSINDANNTVPVPGTFSSSMGPMNDAAAQALNQVTSVSQLSDVQPTDWAFQALQSLVERYGCIAGYPNGTFRGNRAATRYELAAALNACLDQISDKFATKEDLATVKALQEEFKAELATLKGRVDGLEARTSTLEAQQFSTTTKLTGEVVFQASEFFSTDDKRAVATGTPTVFNNSRATFSDRVRLNFDTSFSGKDRLRVRLQARNIQSLATVSGTNQARLGVDGDDSNTFTLDDLYYRFPIGKKAQVAIIANSGEYNDFVNNFNPYLESSGSGAISRFGRFNPIYRFSDGGAGVVANYKFNDKIAVSAGYLADRPNTSTGPSGGFFGGSYSALAQLELQPTKRLSIGITYVHAFQEGSSTDNGLLNLTGSTGSAYARRPFGNNPMNSDSIGAEVNFKVASWMNISGWATYTKASRENGPGSAEVLNWATVFAFPDLIVPGNLGAIVFGQPPRVIGVGDGLARTGDFGTTYHIEALYRIKVNGNITITPGVIVLIDPENNPRNGTEFIPVIRTTFKF